MTAPPLFLLGGRDLEMLEIARLAERHLGAQAVVDKALPWHRAAASSYRAEIEAALRGGHLPVLVELKPDLPAALIDACRIVDHHGARAGAEAPTSLEQVFALLRLPRSAWTRRLQLVAANDRGWIPELRAIGATAEEIERIRAEDRAAQGIGPAEEEQALAALRAREVLHDGSLVLVRLPHDRTATVFDRLALEAQGDLPPDALVAGPEELNFSGSGARVMALARAFPDAWLGGALPDRGFWGKPGGPADLEDALQVLGAAGTRCAQERWAG